MQRKLEILHRWLLGSEPSAPELASLAAETDRERLPARMHLLRRVYPQVLAALPASENLLWHCWHLWLPLAEAITERPRPIVWGILGLQGAGKSTLARLLQIVLCELGFTVICLSIDDLYKTYAERRALQARDPRLLWRGPPGTHDVALGSELLQHVRGGSPLQVPRFDKSLFGGQGDRIEPQIVTEPVDILLFEGWFLGVRPIDPARFERAPWPIQTPADRQFAHDCNTRLADYEPLWNCLDGLLALYPEDYRYSQRWRQEAERRARAAGRSGMSDREVANFVEYFWRALHPELFVRPLLDDARYVERAVLLDAYRQPVRAWVPQQSNPC